MHSEYQQMLQNSSTSADGLLRHIRSQLTLCVQIIPPNGSADRLITILDAAIANINMARDQLKIIYGG